MIIQVLLYGVHEIFNHDKIDQALSPPVCRQSEVWRIYLKKQTKIKYIFYADFFNC